MAKLFLSQCLKVHFSYIQRVKFMDHGAVGFHTFYQEFVSRSLRESKQAELPRAGVLPEMGQVPQKCPSRDFV